MLYAHYKAALYPESADIQDFSKDRALRLLSHLRGEQVRFFAGTVGIEQFTDRIQPHSPGLAERVWYGFQRADEVALALPFTFGADDYTQIIDDRAENLGPALGWTRAQ